MSKLLQFILGWLARRVLQKYHPHVIAVAGSVGKTSTKDTIAHVLKSRYKVGKTMGSFNTELGVPTIIITRGGDIDVSNYHYWSKVQKYLLWLKVIWRGFWMLLPGRKYYPDYLVLELGEDKPGDMEYLIKLVQPETGVMTAFGDVPAHVEFYKSPQQIIDENALLLRALPRDGLAVLNADEAVVAKMETPAFYKVSYGVNDQAQLQALNPIIELSEFADGKVVPFLQTQVAYQGQIVRLSLPHVVAQHQVYPILAALAVAVHYNIDLDDAAASLMDFVFPNHRMHLAMGTKNTLVIDDAYNASPIAVSKALDTLVDIAIKWPKTQRRVLIFSDMLELGTYADQAHLEIGSELQGKVDYLICIGDLAKRTANKAGDFLPPEKIHTFDKVEGLLAVLPGLIQTNDVVLVKGSRNTGIKQVVERLLI